MGAGRGAHCSVTCQAPGVGREEVEGTAENDRLHAGSGSGQQQVIGAAGGIVEAVEAAGRVSRSDGGEVDEGSGVSDGLMGKGGIAQVADEMFLGGGTGGERNGIHGADLMGGLPAGGERLPQPSGAAGNRDTHLF